MTIGEGSGIIAVVQEAKPKRTNPQTLIIKASIARKGQRSDQVKKIKI
jgi:hypothetical protein